MPSSTPTRSLYVVFTRLSPSALPQGPPVPPLVRDASSLASASSSSLVPMPLREEEEVEEARDEPPGAGGSAAAARLSAGSGGGAPRRPCTLAWRLPARLPCLRHGKDAAER